MIEEDILAKLISDKSGVTRSKAQTQLDELAANIKSAVNTGQVFEMEGFGTFKKEQDTTVFEPDEILQTEINQKYAGMRPIELMGSFKETASAQPVEKIEMPEPFEVEEVTEEPVAETSENGFVPPTEQAEPVVNVENNKKAAPEPSTVKESGKKETVESETGAVSIILIIAAAVAALLLVGWLLYSMGVFSSQQTASDVPVENTKLATVDKTQKKPDNVKTAGLTVVDNDIENKNSTADNINKPANAVYGLRGMVQPEARDGYTIIVHSLWRKKRALETLEAIKAKGYRTVMLKASVNSRLYWRIGIGQFKTIKDAKKAIKTLPEPFKSNNFIKHQ